MGKRGRRLGSRSAKKEKIQIPQGQGDEEFFCWLMRSGSGSVSQNARRLLEHHYRMDQFFCPYRTRSSNSHVVVRGDQVVYTLLCQIVPVQTIDRVTTHLSVPAVFKPFLSRAGFEVVSGSTEVVPVKYSRRDYTGGVLLTAFCPPGQLYQPGDIVVVGVTITIPLIAMEEPLQEHAIFVSSPTSHLEVVLEFPEIAYPAAESVLERTLQLIIDNPTLGYPRCVSFREFGFYLDLKPMGGGRGVRCSLKASNPPPGLSYTFRWDPLPVWV